MAKFLINLTLYMDSSFYNKVRRVPTNQYGIYCFYFMLLIKQSIQQTQVAFQLIVIETLYIIHYILYTYIHMQAQRVSNSCADL